MIDLSIYFEICTYLYIVQSFCLPFKRNRTHFGKKFLIEKYSNLVDIQTKVE